jgi:hypothetical protein
MLQISGIVKFLTFSGVTPAFPNKAFVVEGSWILNVAPCYLDKYSILLHFITHFCIGFLLRVYIAKRQYGYFIMMVNISIIFCALFDGGAGAVVTFSTRPLEKTILLISDFFKV